MRTERLAEKWGLEKPTALAKTTATAKPNSAAAQPPPAEYDSEYENEMEQLRQDKAEVIYLFPLFPAFLGLVGLRISESAKFETHLRKFLFLNYTYVPALRTSLSPFYQYAFYTNYLVGWELGCMYCRFWL